MIILIWLADRLFVPVISHKAVYCVNVRVSGSLLIALIPYLTG
jgi:hypothetical protein